MSFPQGLVHFRCRHQAKEGTHGHKLAERDNGSAWIKTFPGLPAYAWAPSGIRDIGNQPAAEGLLLDRPRCVAHINDQSIDL